MSCLPDDARMHTGRVLEEAFASYTPDEERINTFGKYLA
jgi:hypothetical protein